MSSNLTLILVNHQRAMFAQQIRIHSFRRMIGLPVVHPDYPAVHPLEDDVCQLESGEPTAQKNRIGS